MKLETFVWTDELSVGVDAMDDQHKELVTKINKLVEDLAGDSPEAYNDFKDLAGFVVQHFDDEEKFMESVGYLKMFQTLLK